VKILGFMRVSASLRLVGKSSKVALDAFWMQQVLPPEFFDP